MAYEESTNNLVRGMLDPMQFYYYDNGNLVNIPRPTEWVNEQEFTANGQPIPFDARQAVVEAVPKMMTPPEPDKVIEANDVGQELKRALIAGAKEFLSGGMLSQPRKDTGGRNKPINIPSIKTSEKPGWMMAEGTNFWSVNENDPHWQTQQGHDEAVALYGFKPAWVSNPVEKENTFANLEPTVMASNLKKYF